MVVVVEGVVPNMPPVVPVLVVPNPNPVLVVGACVVVGANKLVVLVGVVPNPNPDVPVVVPVLPKPKPVEVVPVVGVIPKLNPPVPVVDVVGLVVPNPKDGAVVEGVEPNKGVVVAPNPVPVVVLGVVPKPVVPPNIELPTVVGAPIVEGFCVPEGIIPFFS